MRPGADIVARMPPLASASRAALGAAGLVAAAGLFALLADEATLSRVAPGLALGLVALSLVPLTGWAGQV